MYILLNIILHEIYEIFIKKRVLVLLQKKNTTPQIFKLVS